MRIMPPAPAAVVVAAVQGMGGAMGGILASTAIMPLEILIFRQRAEAEERSLRSIGAEIWAARGWRGFLPVQAICTNAVEDVVKKGCFYFLYTLVKRGYTRLVGPLEGAYLGNLAVGYATALLNSLPILPFETGISTTATPGLWEGKGTWPTCIPVWPLLHPACMTARHGSLDPRHHEQAWPRPTADRGGDLPEGWGAPPA